MSSKVITDETYKPLGLELNKMAAALGEFLETSKNGIYEWEGVDSVQVALGSFPSLFIYCNI